MQIRCQVPGSTVGRRLTPLTVASLLALGACGGGSSSSTTTDTTATITYPTGLAVGTPTEISAGTTVGLAPQDGIRYAMDFSRSAWKALWSGDTRTLARLASELMPVGRAEAAPSAMLSIMSQAAFIERMLARDPTATLDSVLDLGELFGSSTNASCYGPTMLYSSHQDGAPAAGSLPSGDLGLWTATEGVTPQPCVVAELNARVGGVKKRSRQGLLLTAAMRMAVVDNSLTMPTAGNTLDIQAELLAILSPIAAFAGVSVDAATISLDATGAIYTYRLVMSKGSGASAVSGEVSMFHTPGSSAANYSGVLRVAGFQLSNDPAFTCSDQVDGGTGLFKVALVSTLKYSRAGTAIHFGNRDGNYCGHPTSASSANYAGDVASFTSDGQLDPTVELAGNVRGATLGWRANFNRFAGSYSKVNVTGDFLFAWGAGTGDSHSRAMAVHSEYDSVAEARTLNGYFAFAGDIATTTGPLLGMICNWAGPGNVHTPVSQFQSQTATLSATAPGYVLGTSKITYAPTNSCASTTTAFDVNVDISIAAGEGVGTVVDLDAPTGALTVQEEIELRGYTQPSLF